MTDTPAGRPAKTRGSHWPWLVLALVLAWPAWQAVKAVVLFIALSSPPLWQVIHRPAWQESRMIYVARSRDYGPCKRQPVPMCANYYKEDAVIRLRMPVTLYNYQETVWSPLELRVYMDATTVRPGGEVHWDTQKTAPNLLRRPGGPWDVGLNVADRLPEKGAARVTGLIERLKKDGRVEYMVADSVQPGFTMLDRKGCVDFDSTQRGIPDPTFPNDARFDQCRQRARFFIPEEDSTAVISCVTRAPVPCIVSDLYAGEKIAHSFGADTGQIRDGSWREINRRLKVFILSYKVAG